MPTQTYTLADVTLKSTWKCYQNAAGTYISTEPTTATNGDRVVPVSGLPDGAIINSAVLTYTVPSNPLNGAEISTINGSTIGWRAGNHTANLGITGNGNFQLVFAFKDYGAQHSHTQTHSSVWNLTNLVVTIDYTNPYYASDWSIGAASVDAGNPIPVTLAPAGSGYNHKITAVFGSYSTSVDLATGVNMGSVPTALDWIRAIPNAAAGTANLTLTTYHSGNVIGTSTKSVTITAPSSIVPTLDAAVERLLTVGSVTFPDVTGGYVQQKSAAKCRITSASGAYGSTIAGYSINVGGRTDAAFNASGTELSTAALPMSGNVAITFRVTDSRGRTAQVVKTITVEPYSEPKANNLTVMRVDDSGNEDANGTKGWYSFTRIFSSLGGKNTCVAAITAAGTTVENVGESGWIVPGTIKTLDVLSSYRVEIKLTDVYGSSTTVATIPSINFALHFSADGTSLWVGETCQKSNAFGVSPNRDVYFYGKELRTLIPAYNLLDNSDFRNPVNQRSRAGVDISSGYVLDRWRIWDTGTVYFNAGKYMGLEKTNIFQYIPAPYDRGILTFAAKVWNGSIHVVTYDTSVIGSITNGVCSIIREENALGVELVAGYAYEWAALYEGEYTAETLPPYVPKGYATELAECQRYFRKRGQVVTVGTQYGASDSGLISLVIDGMRISPTVTIESISSQGWSTITPSSLEEGWNDQFGTCHSKNYIVRGSDNYKGQTITLFYTASADL